LRSVELHVVLAHGRNETVVLPARPADIQAKAHDLLAAALAAQEVKDFIAKGAYEAASSTPAELTQEMHAAYDRWGAMVRQIGFEKQ
jgi:tripartite-type tricarboxylate transporter receptor subunit TctC